MADSVREIISELESEFIDEPSLKNSVRTSDGQIVRLDKSLWNDSPVLRKQFEHGSSFLVLTTPVSSVNDVIAAHKHRIFPSDLARLLNLLAATHQLKLQEMFSKCLNALYGPENFTEVEYPPECSTETVMLCFNALLNGPLRTASIYKQQVTRIAEHSGNDRDVMTNAMNLVKHKLEEFTDIGLKGIPVNFRKRVVPIVIYSRNGSLKTAVIDEDRAVTVNIFGENFDLEKFKVEDHFYLKYASYVLYKSGKSVYRKSLRNGSDPVEVLRDCTSFLTRGHFVLAVTAKDDHYSVLRWIDDAKFVSFYQTNSEVNMIDFDYDSRVLALCLWRRFIHVFELDNDALNLLNVIKEMGEIKNIYLSQEKLSVVLYSNGKLHLKPYSLSLISDSPLSEEPSRGREKIRVAGGNRFYYSFEALRLEENHPLSTGGKTLFAERECRALSELWMSS